MEGITISEVQLLSSCFRLEKENKELRDLLHWRDAWGEPPTEHGNYLVQRYEFYGGAELMVLHWNGNWPLRAITHWRPLGPLPGGCE